MAGIEQKNARQHRIVTAALLVLAVGSCSSAPDGPPRAQDDVCAIFAQRPEWRDATEASAARWGVPVELQMAIIWRESSFRGAVRPPRRYALGFIPWGRASSAYGYAQAIDGTWDWYRDETGNSGADRTDFDDAADFVGWYVAKTILTNDVGLFDAYSHYLAYHEGHTGFRNGSYLAKPWLMKVARDVAAQTARYRGQLHSCRA
ncbi:MAG: lytic transglycosylase [Paracoccaceae bacterium]